ncbi:hypothetical protein [Devosia sp. YR412]|nr:hypothetical protein [Devosia sp. YR412]
MNTMLANPDPISVISERRCNIQKLPSLSDCLTADGGKAVVAY